MDVFLQGVIHRRRLMYKKSFAVEHSTMTGCLLAHSVVVVVWERMMVEGSS